ncbi:uncharacterized protein TNCV_3685731 [Trichonephila clavipes]|nr:uncharacterized protein TNCV_3685731 [Trichonephila clavipes]
MALIGSLPQINLGVQGWALDWFEVLGYRVVEDKATDYVHLKQALSEQFPVKDQRFVLGIPRYKTKREQSFPNWNRQENWREKIGNNSRPRRQFNRFENQGIADNQRFDGRRRGGQSDQRFHNQGRRQGGSRNSAFRGQNDRNRYLNF